jgi:hypothetical protein
MKETRFLFPRLRDRFHPNQNISLFDWYKKNPSEIGRALDKLITFDGDVCYAKDPAWLFDYSAWIRDKGFIIKGIRGYDNGLIFDV